MAKKKLETQAPLPLEEPKLPLAKCSDCPLREYPVVPPSGDGKDYILIVGEAPGTEEVKKGRPFIGRAGILLHETMTRVGMNLERVYYTNSVMCRPPDNRDPTSTEIDHCRSRLFKEISDVNPHIIMPLGKFGHLAVTGRKEGITIARGKPEYLSINESKRLTMSSVHPAGLFRNPYGFPDLCFDLERAIGICNGEDIIIHPPTDKYFIISSEDELKMEGLLNRLDTVEEMSVDLETTSLRYLEGKILSCALSWQGETAVSFDWDVLRKSKVHKERFAKALSRIRCSFQNGPFDIPWLRMEGVDPNYDFDTMLGNYVLDERKGVHGLERQSITRYKAPSYKFTKEQISKAETSIPRHDLLIYNATDADYTRRLTIDIANDMDDKDAGVMADLVMPAAEHFTEFFMTGMLADQDHLESNGKRWREEIEEIEGKLREFPGAADLNFNSPKQIAPYLYDKDKLNLRQMPAGSRGVITPSTLLDEIRDIEDPEAQDYWRTQSSKSFSDMSPRSTSTYMLYWLSQQHEFPRVMVRHRLLSKKYGTYYQGLKDALWPDGRMRPQVKLHGTVTGRQSSSDPNIHGTPRLDDIKSTYIADEGFLVLYGDLSQAEIRMMAHLSGDKALLKKILGEDIHDATIKMLFKITEAQLARIKKDDPEKYEVMRRAAKTIRFGIQYGRAAKGLAVQLAIPVEEAQLYLDQIFGEEKDVLRWIVNQKHLVEVKGEVESIYHRKRRFPLIADKRQRSEMQRQGVNMPVSSSVSDMTLRGYIKTYAKLEKAGIRVMRWPQIHDAFMILVEKSAIAEAAKIMKDTMENDLDFETEVPFIADLKCGPSWGDLHALEG